MSKRQLLATIISTIGNPMVIGLFFGGYLYFFNHDADTYKALPLTFSVFVVFPIFAFTSYKVYRKEFEDYDVSDQIKRNQLYLFVLLVFLVLNVFMYFKAYPLKALLLGAFIFLHILASYLFNTRIKVSMHTSFAFLFAFFFYPINPAIGIGLFIFAFINAWSRLVLGRHSSSEVRVGGMIGLVNGSLYLILFYYLLSKNLL